jgi:hypothetical protein
MLFELPLDVAKMVMELFTLKDIWRLDCASVSTIHRPIFLSLLSGLEIKEIGRIHLLSPRLINWLLLRRVMIKKIIISSQSASMKELLCRNQLTLTSASLASRSEVKYGFLGCLKSCPCLTELKFQFCSFLRDREVETLLSLPHLDRLDLTGCLRLSSVTIETISRCCHLLRELSLSSLTFVSDAEVRFIISGCPSLCRLDLSHTSVTDVSLHVILEELHLLEHLRLRSCVHITSPGFCFFLNSMVARQLFDRRQETQNLGAEALDDILQQGE